jgi:pyruvate kinase
MSPFRESITHSRTKIVATLGPSSSSIDVIQSLVRAGATVFRLNFSHGSHDDHATSIAAVRAVSAEINAPLGILADLCGPKIRVGLLPPGGVFVAPGDRVILSSDPAAPADRIPVLVANLHVLIEPGRRVLIEDGLVHLVVVDVRGTDVICEARNSGVIRSRKGLNLPGTHLPISAMTEKDREDLRFALSHGVDIVALSFVRSPADLDDARDIIRQCGAETPVIAKIEQAEAVTFLDEIIDAADGAMVARGDLGVEVEIEELPRLQGRIIHRCNMLGKPVITATHMLNSMIENPVPTRAEVTDIYNAIYHGTDAVMLSGETAMGRYPIESVQMMNRVALAAERDMRWGRDLLWDPDPATQIREGVAVASAAVSLAANLNLKAIVCATRTGRTAMRVARHRPKCPILAFSTDTRVQNRLCLVWGVEARAMEPMWGSTTEGGETEAILANAMESGLKHNLLSSGDRIAFITGLPWDVPGRTNTIRIYEVGSTRESRMDIPKLG